MNKNTRTRLAALLKLRKKFGERTSGFKARRSPYPKIDKRQDLAWSFGYDGKGNYIGKSWSRCY